MRREEWPLLALAASPDLELSPVQAQKALFLLAKGLRAARSGPYYTFRPYHYGPFDPAVYADLDRYVDEGLVERLPSEQYKGYNYHLTRQGRAVAEIIARDAGENITRYVNELVGWIRPLSFSELVSAVYEQYPEFKKKSIFRSSR